MTLDTVVLLSGTGSNLQALLEVAAQNPKQLRIVCAIADRDAAGLAYAAAAGVDTAVVRPQDYADREAWAAALTAKIQSYGVNSARGLVVSAGFMRIVPPSFVSAFAPRLINVHPALLPNFPGANAVPQALAAGATITGATVHHIDAGVDTGQMIAQEAVPVLPDDSVASLHERIKTVERVLLPRVVLQFAAGQLPHPQRAVAG